jgi:hypothetical protein
LPQLQIFSLGSPSKEVRVLPYQHFIEVNPGDSRKMFCFSPSLYCAVVAFSFPVFL